MSKSENQVTEVLRLEGIMAQGYGLNPKLVMRDKRLSPEAKCIYAYFSSFAGAGNQAFPSRALMLDELRMSVKRYYKYLKELLDCDYIRIERCKTSDHKFDKNIYTLVALPNPTEKQTQKLEQKPDMGSESKSAGKTGSKPKPLKRIKVKEKASIIMLKEQLDVDSLKEQMPEQKELLEDLLITADDMLNSEQINIGGTIKKKEAINDMISKLTADHIRYIVNNIIKNKSKVIHKKAYLQSCLYNSIFNINEINTSPSISKTIKNEKKEEEREKEMAKKLKIEQYNKFPKLKQIDEELLNFTKKLSLSVFSNKQDEKKDIMNRIKDLEDQRNKFLSENKTEEVS